jgi:hypothetical protein
MKKLMFAFLLMGCGSKSSGGMDGKLDELSGIKDKMCACTDKTCADSVRDEFVTWKKGNNGGDNKPTKDQDDRFKQLRAGMMECRHKVAGAGDDSGGGTGGGHGHDSMAGSGSAPAPAAGSGS